MGIAILKSTIYSTPQLVVVKRKKIWLVFLLLILNTNALLKTFKSLIMKSINNKSRRISTIFVNYNSRCFTLKS